MVAYDDDEVMERAVIMLARHSMRLKRRITHDPVTHVTRFYIEHDAEPGIHIAVELPIDVFEPELFAQNVWLTLLEQEAVRRFSLRSSDDPKA
jgi:hypothetical protein